MTITLTGLQEALKSMKAGYDPTKMVTLSYKISSDKKVGDKTYFTVTIKVNSKGVKKAKLKKADKKAFTAFVNKLNAELQKEENRRYFEIAPIKLDDATMIKSVKIKATFKKGKIQTAEDGTLKGVKSLAVKVAIPGIDKPETFTYKKNKATKAFTIAVTDADNKKVTIAPTSTNTGFTGSRATLT